MIKYKRFIQKLENNLKYIFAFEGVSVDSKAIVLILAATMSRLEFSNFVDKIAKFDSINVQLKQINNLRYKLGDLFMGYIIAYTFKYLDHDVDEAELLLLMGTDEASAGRTQSLQPALVDLNIEAQPHENLNPTVNKAINYLVQNLDLYHHDKCGTILDTYLHCRSSAEPNTAFQALIFAMAKILSASGLDSKNSLVFSYKLAKHSLAEFTKTDNSILHSYKTFFDPQ